MQRCGFDKFLHRGRICVGVLTQRPPNGFVDKEFIRVQIFADDRREQIKIGILFVAKLKQDRRSPQP